MKKLLFLLGLALSVIFVSSCEKEEVTPASANSDCVVIKFINTSSTASPTVKYKRSTGEQGCFKVPVGGEYIKPLCDVSGPESIFITDFNDLDYPISIGATSGTITYDVMASLGPNKPSIAPTCP
jgi:hypothetical protein